MATDQRTGTGGSVECDAFLGGKKLVPRDQLQFRPAVYGLVIHEDQLLVVDIPRTGRLALPGGAVEPGEKLEWALRRDCAEEVGIEVTVGAMAGFQEGCYYYEPLDHAFHIIAFYYRCAPRTFELLAEHQIRDTETCNPHWAEIESLRAEDFQCHGDLILGLVTESDARSPRGVPNAQN